MRHKRRRVKTETSAPDAAASTLIDPARLARWLGITVPGVKQAETEGRLPTARRTPGGHRRWVAADLVAHLRARGATVPPELLALVGEAT